MSFLRSTKSKLGKNPFVEIFGHVADYNEYKAHEDLVAHIKSLNTATADLKIWIEESNLDTALPTNPMTGRARNLVFFQIADLLFQLEQLKEIIKGKEREDIANIDLSLIDGIIARLQAFPQFNNDAYVTYVTQRRMTDYIDGLLNQIEGRLNQRPLELQNWIMNLKALFNTPQYLRSVSSAFQLLKRHDVPAEEREEKHKEELFQFRLHVHALNEEIKAAKPDGNLASALHGNEAQMLDKYVGYLTTYFERLGGYIPPLVALNEPTTPRLG
jgi:hypothetical protein